VQAAAIASVTAHPWLAHPEEKKMGELLLVGTQTKGSSKGIYAYDFNSADGELKQIGLAAQADNPTFLALSPDRQSLLAGNELDEYEGKSSGAVSIYALDRAHAKLTKINEVASKGAGTAHVAFDHTGRCAFAANYNGGSASSFHIEKGEHLSPVVSFEQFHGHGPNPDRQAQPHAHRVTPSPDNRFLLVNDLGLDLIHVFHLDAATAKLTPNDPPAWHSEPGSGPRALRFHPDGKIAYCVNEIKSTVDVLQWDAQRGVLTTVEQVNLLPENYHGATRGCDIVLDRAARHAYVANRDDNFMATFTVAPDGKLTLVGRSSCGGDIPRHLTLDPTERWLLVANQESDNIAVFRRDEATGRLAESGKSFPLSKPQCLVFA
jgi:6-phosphogluconolactonase